MDSNTYRVRIYGCSSRDPKKFREDLATVLGIGIYAAGRLLEQRPILVKYGIPKADGENLCARLKSISAWSVLETEDGDVVLMTRPDDAVPTAPPLKLLGQTHSKRDGSHSKFWPGIPARVAGLIAVLVIGCLFILVTRSDQPGPLFKACATEASQTQVAWISDTSQELTGDIEARIEDLQCTLSALYARRAEIQKSRKPVATTSMEQDVQTQIQTTYQELQTLKAKLSGIESRKTQ